MATIFRDVIRAPRRQPQSARTWTNNAIRATAPFVTQSTALPPRRARQLAYAMNPGITSQQSSATGPTNRHHLSLSLGAGFS